MDWQSVSEQLLNLLGGKENIRSVQACMTRLRIGVYDIDKVKTEEIKAVPGVLGVVESDTIQIVFGPGKVDKAREAFLARYERVGMPGTAEIAKTGETAGRNTEDNKQDTVFMAKKNKKARREKFNKPLQRFLKRIANIFVPMLPGIVAAGLINGIINIINVRTGGSFSGVWWYECISSMGWALFAYLPVFTGYNAAGEFGGSPILGGIIGAICVANPSMPLLKTIGETQIHLPMTGTVYNPGNGGLIAALIAGALFACLEKKIRKYMPDSIDTIISPLIVLVIAGIVIVSVIQPVSTVLTNAIYVVLKFVYSKMGVAGGYILSAGFLPLVSVGLHQALVPIHTMLNDPAGPTGGVNYLLPLLMMSGGGQVGAGVALYIKTGNKKLKQVIRDSLPVGILGIGEPLMYAVTLPLGKPFVMACLGAGFGGAVMSLFHVGAISQGVSGIFGLLIIEPGDQLQYLLAMICAITGGFVLTWFFGTDEQRINEIYGTI